MKHNTFLGITFYYIIHFIWNSVYRISSKSDGGLLLISDAHLVHH